jgi:EPS-associated MarR family transcriptional regulator
MPLLQDQDRYRLLRRLAENPGATQRELAQELGVSVGKVNYCLKALIGRGLLKINNFRASGNKRAYVYYLTPKGAEEKARVTVRFLRQKMTEYEILKKEIEELRGEARATERQGRPEAMIEGAQRR